MSFENFQKNFAEAIEIPEGSISQDCEFKKLDIWDSMNALNVIAMIDVNYNKTIGGDEIEQSTTLLDLWKKIGVE